MVNLFSPLQGDYASRSAELARQQKLAQMLEQMSQQEIPVSTAGGITAPVSPYGALAKALSSFGGSYLSGKSAADEAELKKSDQEMAQKVAQNLYVMPTGSRQPDVGMIDTKGIEGAGPSFAVTGKTNLEDTATTPQQQLQMLAPLMAGGEASRSVYNAFMPGVMSQQSSNIERQNRLADAEAERQQKLRDAETERQRVLAQESTLTRPDNVSEDRWNSAGKVPGLRTQLFQNNAIEKHGEYYQQLVDAGLKPGTPAFNAAMERKLRKDTYIAPVTGPSPGAPQSYIIDGKQVFTTPQDALSRAQKGSTVAVASPSATPTEGERKAATLYGRLKFSLDQLKNATTESPNAASPSALASIAGSINPVLGNLATSEDRQRVEAAQLDILDAALTLGTGAAYTKEQLEGYRKSYFPQYLDKPQNIIDKQNRLANIIKQAEVAAGRAANLAVSQKTEPTVDPERAELERLRAEKAARDAQKPGAR